MRSNILTEDLEMTIAQAISWEDLRGQTVLVSGANGFLPAFLVETLLYRNEQSAGPPTQVVALVRNHDKARVRFAHYEDRSDLTLLVQDVCEATIAGEVDYVIHAASQASPAFYGVDPVGTLSANTVGTHRLLELARSRRVKSFLFFSSSEVYGTASSENLIRETTPGAVDPCAVRSCYAESKRMGETMCVAWHHQYGVPARIVRIFHTYGPGMPLYDGRAFSDFVGAVLTGCDMVLHGDGTAVRAYCYLADAAAAFFTVLLRGLDGHAYNVGNNQQEASVRELARHLLALEPDTPLRLIEDPSRRAFGLLPSSVQRISPDTTKIESLGWRPRYSLEEGLKRTLLDFRHAGTTKSRSQRLAS